MVFRTLVALARCAVFFAPPACLAVTNDCVRQSGATMTPVVELYTSEGCSSCPPADRWLSGLRPNGAGAAAPVIQAFHVEYWDTIGWVDRFASPAHTARQRQIAGWNGLRSIYTPQVVLNARDWRDWHLAGTSVPASSEPARAAITLKQLGENYFEAVVSANAYTPARWGAYWTVTEHGHRSSVKAGENAGETLRHAYVVRQYVPVGEYRSDTAIPQKLLLRSIAPTPGSPRQVNLVVFDSRTGNTLQALSTDC